MAETTEFSAPSQPIKMKAKKQEIQCIIFPLLL